ncbi:MAG: YaaA family protein [Microthrixaceae bacterium]
MAAPVVLLPPSEAKVPDGRGAPFDSVNTRFAELDDHRRLVAEALAAAMVEEGTASRLLGVRGSALAAAREANRKVLLSATLATSARYRGVLYEEAKLSDLEGVARRRLNRQVVVFSGLFGLLTPSDPIPDYKLKMGATLAPMGRLSSWWRPRLTTALDPIVDGRVVWDLLPQEHSAAWDHRHASYRTRIRVRFADVVGGTDAEPERLVTVSHWNKLLKGALLRHLLATNVEDPEHLTTFTHPRGYRYRPELTVVEGREVEVTLAAPSDHT